MSEAVALAPPPAPVNPIDPLHLPKLYAALSKAQAAIQNAEMNALNEGFKGPNKPTGTKYADLAAVLNAIRKPFSDNGLALFHTIAVDKGFTSVKVTVHVTHESGEHFENDIDLPVLAKTPQSVGSSFTYGRRYTAAAVAGIAQEDDDGMGGPMVGGGKAPPPPKTKPGKPDAPAGTPAPTIPEEWKERLDQFVAQIKETQTVQDVDDLAMKNQDFAKGVAPVRELVARVFKAQREHLAKEKKG